MTDPYAEIADLYDLEHDNFTDDTEMVIQLVTNGFSPVLEMGCGTGRLLGALALEGVPVAGIDQSPTMLRRAAARMESLSAQFSLVEGDFQHPASIVTGKYGLVMYSLNALMHLETQEAQIESLRSAQTLLVPGGGLVIDLLHPHPEELDHLNSGPIREGVWHLEDNSTVEKWSHRAVHPADQTIDTDLWYDLTDANGNLRRIRTSFTHRYLHPGELTLILQMLGYENITLYGDYQFGPYFDHAERLIALASCPA